MSKCHMGKVLLRTRVSSLYWGLQRGACDSNILNLLVRNTMNFTMRV